MADDDLPDLVGKLGEVARSKGVLNVAVYTVIVVWLVTFGVVAFFGDHARAQAGLLGDSFGALNTLFSGLALLGVFYAVLLQRQEIDIALKDAKDSEAARQKAEGLLARQAEALLAGAQLNAVNSLLMSEEKDRRVNESVYSGKRSFGINRAEVMRQYLRIILNQIASPGADAGERSSTRASIFRQYILNLTRDVRAKLQTLGLGESWWAINSRAIDLLTKEFWMILGHDGVTGSPDAQFIEFGLNMLYGIGMTMHREKDPRDDVQIWRTIDGALNAIEVNARTGA